MAAPRDNQVVSSDDEDDAFFMNVLVPAVMLFIDESNGLFAHERLTSEEKPGRGNARAGVRRPYYLRDPSTQSLLHTLFKEPTLWHHFCPLAPGHFMELVHECEELWSAPRTGTEYRPRKHSIETSLFGTISTLRQNLSVKGVEQLIGVDDAVAFADFYRNLEILATVLTDELQWPSEQDRENMRGQSINFPNVVGLLDATDCPVKCIGKNAGDSSLYYSYKLKGPAMRFQICCGLDKRIWHVESGLPGINNDQSIFANSDLAQGNPQPYLTRGQTVAADGGYVGTAEFPLEVPATTRDIALNPMLRYHNRELSEVRVGVECCIGDLKNVFGIMTKGYRRKIQYFPLVVRVCAMLLNRIRRLYGHV